MTLAFEVLKLSEQIARYVLQGDDSARIELLNQVINGDELTEALAYLKSEIEKHKGYIKTEAGYIKSEEYEPKFVRKELLNNLEEIIKGKKGTMPREIQEKILDRYMH